MILLLTVVSGIYMRRTIPVKTGETLSLSLVKICAQEFNALLDK